MGTLLCGILRAFPAELVRYRGVTDESARITYSSDALSFNDRLVSLHRSVPIGQLLEGQPASFELLLKRLDAELRRHTSEYLVGNHWSVTRFVGFIAGHVCQDAHDDIVRVVLSRIFADLPSQVRS